MLLSIDSTVFCAIIRHMRQVISSFHAIEELLGNVQDLGEGGASSKYQILYSKKGPRTKKIISLATTFGISVSQVTDAELCRLSADNKGIVLLCEGTANKTNFIPLDSLLEKLQGCESGTLLVLDGVTDAGNVASICRTSLLLAVDAIIVPRNGAIGEAALKSAAMLKNSVGASASINFCIVTNLCSTIGKLQAGGFWVYGADLGGNTLGTFSFAKKSAIVMGSEGNGISRLAKEKCDMLISIPMTLSPFCADKSAVDSFNVAVATGIVLYARHAGEAH